MVKYISMANVILYIATSLDGYIADTKGGVGWLEKYPHGKEDYGYKNFLSRTGTLIMGSNTYETVLKMGAWPYKNKKTYVVSSRKFKRDKNVTFYNGDLEALVEEIENEEEGDIWLVGGGKLAAGFINSRLVDEMRLFVVPVLLGTGIRLFTDEVKKSTFKVIAAITYKSGVIELHYQAKKRVTRS